MGSADVPPQWLYRADAAFADMVRAATGTTQTMASLSRQFWSSLQEVPRFQVSLQLVWPKAEALLDGLECICNAPEQYTSGIACAYFLLLEQYQEVTDPETCPFLKEVEEANHKIQSSAVLATTPIATILSKLLSARADARRGGPFALDAEQGGLILRELLGQHFSCPLDDKFKELLDAAALAPLSLGQQMELIRYIDSCDGHLLGKLPVVDWLSGLIYNNTLAAECLIRQMSTSKAFRSDLLRIFLELQPCRQTFECVAKTLCKVNGYQPETESFLHEFLSTMTWKLELLGSSDNCRNENTDEQQEKLIPLFCTFIKSLLGKGLLIADVHALEIQSFAMTFARYHSAAGLYALVQQYA